MSQSQIYSVCNQLSDRISDLLQAFNVKYEELDNRFTFCCPVHSGDNPNGACIFKDGTKSRGNWVCWTHGCQEKYGALILGFIKGALEKRHGRTFLFGEAIDFALKFLKKEAIDIPDEPELYTVHRINQLNEIMAPSVKRQVPYVDRSIVLSELNIPSQYFLGRGYSAEILTEFDVGDCYKFGKLMNGRAVAPVYNSDYHYVGCSGRTTAADVKKFKWINSKDFKTNEYLYGLWIAQPYIESSKTVILVEGQGDVWRMHEAGLRNTVGIFGSDLSDFQLEELEKLLIFDVIVLTDMDEAGRKAAASIVKKCGNRFNMIVPKLSNYKDVGEMTVEQIKEELGAFIR